MERLRGRFVEDLVAEGGEAEAEAWPVCPHCGGKLEHRGQRVREVLIPRQATPLQVRRAYGVCSSCGAGLFPLGSGHLWMDITLLRQVSQTGWPDAAMGSGSRRREIGENAKHEERETIPAAFRDLRASRFRFFLSSWSKPPRRLNTASTLPSPRE